MARIVVPPGDVTASRSSTGCIFWSRNSSARAEHRLHDQLGRDLAREAEQNAGLDHRLGEQCEIRGA